MPDIETLVRTLAVLTPCSKSYPTTQRVLERRNQSTERRLQLQKNPLVGLHGRFLGQFHKGLILMEKEEVTITLRTIGPGRPSLIRVPSSIKVHDLRKRIAADIHLPVEHLKLVLQGEVLHDTKNGLDASLRLNGGDSVIVAVVPKPPPKHIQDGYDGGDEDDELKFRIPQSTSQWKKRVFSFLHDRLRLPDILLMAIFSIGLKAWAVVLLWFTLAPVAYRLDFGPLYILGTGFSIILLNLGQRQNGDLSAYSVFNDDFRELPGTLNADRLDRDIRAVPIPTHAAMLIWSNSIN